MKTIGIIPARYGSTRFEAKPLADILGKSMVQRVWEQCKKSGLLDEVIIATDDQRIYDHAVSFGAQVRMTKVDHQSGTDRCAEVLSLLEKEGFSPELLVNIQGDEPLINPRQIDDLVSFVYSRAEIELASQYRIIEDSTLIASPNTVKVVTSDTDRALYFSRSVIPFERKAIGVEVKKHVGMYAYRAKVLKAIAALEPSKLELTESLEQLRWLANDFQIYMTSTDYPTIGVDTPEDLEKVEHILRTS